MFYKFNDFETCLYAGVAPGSFRQGADSSDRGLKYGCQGIVNAKNLHKIVFHLPTGGSMFRQGATAPSSPPLAPTLFIWDETFSVNDADINKSPALRESKRKQ